MDHQFSFSPSPGVWGEQSGPVPGRAPGPLRASGRDKLGRAAEHRSRPTKAQGRKEERPCSEWLGGRAAVIAQFPFTRLRLPQQPYIIKEGQDKSCQPHSDGAGLLPLQLSHQVSQDHQSLHGDSLIAKQQDTPQVWQKDLYFSCLFEKESFPLGTRSVCGKLPRQPAGPTWQGVALGASEGQVLTDCPGSRVLPYSPSLLSLTAS